jgi:hypothetical protein
MDPWSTPHWIKDLAASIISGVGSSSGSKNTKMSASFHVVTAVRKVQKVARPCPVGRTGWRGPPHVLHFCFSMFIFMLVCCRRSAGCLVTRLWLGDRGIVSQVLAKNFFLTFLMCSKIIEWTLKYVMRDLCLCLCLCLHRHTLMLH